MKHQDFLEVGLADDQAALQRRLVAFAEALDFPLVSAVLVVNRPGAKSSFVGRLGNTPQAFADSAVDEASSKRDPVLQRMLRVSTPFTYDQSLYVKAGAGDLWEHQAPFGYRNGVQVALHSGAGRHFLLGIDRPDTLPEDDAALGRLLADVQLLAVYAQDAAVRVLIPPEESTLVPHLTPRQLDVLRWYRDGKTTSETAEILNVTIHAVDYHLRCIREKFGVADTRQALMKAISVGLI